MQLPRVGEFAREHAPQCTSSEAAKARGFDASAITASLSGLPVVSNEIPATIIHVDFARIWPT
jgi:hypothetical protein